jgi:hypothetical protein
MLAVAELTLARLQLHPTRPAVRAAAAAAAVMVVAAAAVA